MLGNLGKGLVLRLASYALFLCGFWMLYQAFERSHIAIGVAGGAAILAAMWAMVGFRRPPSISSETSRDGNDSDSPSSGQEPGPRP